MGIASDPLQQGAGRMHQDQALLVARGAQQGTVRRRLNSIS